MLCFEPPQSRTELIGGQKTKEKKEDRKNSPRQVELQPWIASGEEAPAAKEEDYDADDDLEEECTCYQYNIKTNVSINTNEKHVW